MLQALKRKQRLMPPGKEHVIELGDDRLRTSLDDKVDADLRGAQPKENLTPRTLLDKPFALLVTDSLHNPKGVTLRGPPAAHKILSTLPLRESVSYLQIAYPDKPVSGGDSWHAKRFARSIGKLGMAVDVEYRLVGFERVSNAPCAHLVIRSQLDANDVPSVIGFSFSEVHYKLRATPGSTWQRARWHRRASRTWPRCLPAHRDRDSGAAAHALRGPLRAAAPGRAARQRTGPTARSASAP